MYRHIFAFLRDLLFSETPYYTKFSALIGEIKRTIIRLLNILSKYNIQPVYKVKYTDLIYNPIPRTITENFLNFFGVPLGSNISITFYNRIYKQISRVILRIYNNMDTVMDLYINDTFVKQIINNPNDYAIEIIDIDNTLFNFVEKIEIKFTNNQTDFSLKFEMYLESK